MSLIPRSSLFDFDQLFDRFGTSDLLSDKESGFFSPRIEVKELKDKYQISAELPGVDKDDVNVTLDNGVLTIEAECRQEDKEEKEGRVLRQERRYGKFMRSFNLGRDVKQDDIKAEFKNGVLTLSAPKTAPAAPESRRIDIH